MSMERQIHSETLIDMDALIIHKQQGEGRDTSSFKWLLLQATYCLKFEVYEFG